MIRNDHQQLTGLDKLDIIAMFSSIMESVLTKFLGKYVDGIKNNIDINITGNATIQKISLRPQFINSLGLPVLLKYSHISKILVNVPWASLKEKPTTVTVQGLYVLLSLKYDDEEIEVEPAKKIKPIINRVKQEIKKKWEQKEANKTETFAEKSIIRIIDNLIINIDEIHVRVESMKRNWDFSFGVVIDKISSFTVNEYGQKCFYTRHFTNKQSNPPLKKSFTCERFQIYFNDQEDFFMCDKDKPEQIKKLLMEPFQSKNVSAQNSPKKGIINKVPTLEFKQSYKMKILSKFSFDIIAEQKLSSDKKYIVEVKGQLPRVCFMISDIQLSQILVFLQLIYEWVIDREKNGRRDFIFDEKTQIEYKKILLKLAKEDKTSPQQMQILYNIASQTPLQKLQNAADNLIRDYRIEKEMKKINKVSNKQKSKEMIEKLFERMENQNKEVLELFEHIIIELNIPQFRLSCMKGANALLEVGVTNIASDIKLVLSKHTLVSVLISQPFVTLTHLNQTRNLVILDKPQYSTQPFMSFSLSLLNKSPPNVKMSLKKRYIQLNQQVLSNLVTWISCIRLKPPIINFLNEQLNYSIYITQEIFSALFSSANLALDFNIEVPILAVQLKSLLEYNFGTLKITRENEEQYWIELTETQSVMIDGQQIMALDAGLRVSLINIKPQTVKIDVVGFNFKNSSKVFKFASQIIKSPIVKQVLKLDPIVEEETIFEGKFMLNQYATPQNMLLKGNYLKFLPCGDQVYLLRTKMYPFEKKGKFGLIFREQVQKVINIVLMDSEKTMSTLFETIRDYMLRICTIPQWKKYYLKFPNEVLTSVSQVQTQQENLSLIDLLVAMSSACIHVGRTESDTSLVSVSNLKSTINYKEYNTDAKADVGCFGIVMGKQKIIENLVIGVDYSYQDCMNLGINVHALRFNVDSYEVIQHIMHMSAQYSFMVANLMKTVKEVMPPRPQPDYVEEKLPSAEDISYLLESKVNLQLSNCEAFIIGFRNSLKSSSLELSKYRNTSMPVISLKLRNVILMSAITLSSCQLQTNSNNTIHVILDNLAVYLSLQLLLYELTVGRGSSFVNSIIDYMERRKKQDEGQGTIEEQQAALPSVNVELRGFKTRFRFTEHQEVSTSTKYISVKISKNEQDKSRITIQATLNKLYLLINSNMILEPIGATLTMHCNKQFLPLEISSYVEPILINVSVHNLIETAIVMKISLQRVFNLEIVRAFIKEQLSTVARNPRLESVAKKQGIHMNFKVDTVKMVLYSWQNFQLVRVKFEEINLDTKRGNENEVVCSIEHLNSLFRIYEPVLEQTKIIMCIKDGPQAVVSIPEIRLNVSQQFARDIIHELFLAKENLDRSLKQTKFNLYEQSITTELQKYKSIITNMIIPEEMEECLEQEEQVKAMQQKYMTNILKIRSKIQVEILAEVIFDNKKTKVQLKDEIDQKQIEFQVRSEYKESYEMVEKYKQIIIKLSLLHPKFSTQCLYFTVSLFKTAYTYHTCKFIDEFGQETESCVGIYVYQDPNSSEYNLEIISPYRVLNATTLALNLNWLKNQESFQRELKQNDEQWISPWICDKVSINANNQHLFASSYPIVFAQPSDVYEISLNSAINNDSYNFCCLAVEREIFEVEKWIIPSGQSKKKCQICPATMIIKPTYFVINHFHSPVFINDTECSHKQKVPLYSMFRTKKNEHFFKIRMGDGSMHEVYLPKPGHSVSVELKIKNDNYITISILRQKPDIGPQAAQPAHLSSSASLRRSSSLTGSLGNEHVYHIYAKLQLLVSLPKSQSLTLCTSILSTRYTLKKELQLDDVQFEHAHPTIVAGRQKPSVNLIRDRFNFHTYVHVLDQFEKYLEIKSNNRGWYSKQITLYPSYYGNDVSLYKNIPEDKEKKQAAQAKLVKKYLINYEFTKIGPQIIMYYVSILPKYYILNLSHEVFSVDGQGQLKYNERIVVDSDEAEIVYTENSVRWEMLNDKLEVNLSAKKEIIFFKQLLFKEYEMNQELKGRHRRKSSHNLNVQDEKHKITIESENIKVFQILKHIGSYSATTFCIKEWNEWLNIHNNLSYPLMAVSRYSHGNIEIAIATTIKPGEVGNHPYGIQDMPAVEFSLIYKESVVEIGTYQTNLRFNDEIELSIQEEVDAGKEADDQMRENRHQESKQKDKNLSKEVEKKSSRVSQKIQTIVMYEIRKSQGRKIVFSLVGTVENQQSAELNKKIKALIIPVFLRISQSLKVTIDNIFVSLIVSCEKNRKELLRLSANSLDFLLLAYPTGLYMLHLVLGLDIHAPQFPEPVLSAPNIQFYLQAVQQKFIERMTLKVSKQITVFLTDKLIYEIVNVGLKMLHEIKEEQKIFSTDPKMLEKEQQNDGFYTSSLNSVMISEIQARVTVKKMLIQNKQNHKKLVDMGLSIAQLEDSGIKLPKIDIEQPVNANHISSITKKYVMEIIKGCLGGMNLIGNPKQFIEQIEAGTSRGMPVIGFIGGVFAGTTNSMSKIISTVSNSVSQLSMDVEYQKQRNQIYMNQQKGIANGLKQGSKSLFSSVKSGVVGLYKRPKEGLEEEGGIGLIKGTLSGIAGIFVKSATGVMDAASITVRGIKSASSYSQKDQQEHSYYEKPFYHKFKVIRPYNKTDELAFNALIRAFQQQKLPIQNIDIIESAIIEDEKTNGHTNEMVIVTSDKLYVVNSATNEIAFVIPNQKMNATGKFNEGVVLYYNQNQHLEQGIQHEEGYDHREYGEEIVFRVASNVHSKERLYASLKAFVDLHTQTKDKDEIPQ